MRQAVRVGRQNTVATDPFTGQNRNSKWQRYPAQSSGRLAAKDFVPSASNASLNIGMAARGVLSSLLTLPNQPRQRPFYSRDGRGVVAFASKLPDCRLANL